MDNFDPRITVATVVERGGLYLLVEETPHGTPVLNQPAGHLEGGETLAEGAVRETLEETGYRVAPTALVGVYVWTSPANGATYFRFCFAADIVEQVEGYLTDPDIDARHWYSLDELRARQAMHRSPLVLRCVEDHATGRRFPLDMIFDADAVARAAAGGT